MGGLPCGSGSQGPADTAPTGTAAQAAQSPQAVPVQLLQRKLKEAAREIACLRREKEQLLELGNRLRAELGRPAGEPAWGLAGCCALGMARWQGEQTGLRRRSRRSQRRAAWCPGQELVSHFAGGTGEGSTTGWQSGCTLCAPQAAQAAVPAPVSQGGGSVLLGLSAQVPRLPASGWGWAAGSQERWPHSSERDAHTFLSGHCYVLSLCDS